MCDLDNSASDYRGLKFLRQICLLASFKQARNFALRRLTFATANLSTKVLLPKCVKKQNFLMRIIEYQKRLKKPYAQMFYFNTKFFKSVAICFEDNNLLLHSVIIAFLPALTAQFLVKSCQGFCILLHFVLFFFCVILCVCMHK